ncbi:peptidase S8/S53 domain-containing protein [Fimicolochytrium jonesii]|uniref:peptidase S8/S53 domain-containing protein n=1 Tax=Fimicolochytrium jonesii TaxID=1396493 RepID=UPI0022FF127C|nr:peptidase S8/S53 domain-containing protein [Fimicolochytrium jonesii]KAI8824359.1 peptidase S8/S53 domain-containing protein [Fimicolochytrium jonesii]
MLFTLPHSIAVLLLLVASPQTLAQQHPEEFRIDLDAFSPVELQKHHPENSAWLGGQPSFPSAGGEWGSTPERPGSANVKAATDSGKTDEVLSKIKAGTDSVSDDRYIVAMLQNITKEDIDRHVQWVSNTLLNGGIIPPALAKKFSGIATMFNSDVFKGYTAHLPPGIIHLIDQSELVRFVEKDQKINHAQAPKSNGSEDGSKFVSSSGFFMNVDDSSAAVQQYPPWGLDRITHRQAGLKGVYVFPPDGGQGVDIYILDTGINHKHPDFKGRARQGPTFSSNGLEDGNGHGTHVAGIAASSTWGVAKAANIIGVKVLDNDGTGFVSQVVQGLEWSLLAVGNGTRRGVINMSLAGGGKSQALDELVRKGREMGVPLSAAAGNDNINACDSSPSSSGAVMTVGASDQQDKRAVFSNFGPCVNIFAPGTNITSTYIPGSATATLQGSSMAAPHVAGIMAIFLSLYPEATADDVYTTVSKMATAGAVADSKDSTPALLFSGMNATRFADLYYQPGGSGWMNMVWQTLQDSWI